MNCTQCGLHFCWLCNEEIEGYIHFGMDGPCLDRGFATPTIEEHIEIWERIHKRKFTGEKTMGQSEGDYSYDYNNDYIRDPDEYSYTRKKSKLKSAGKFGLYAVGFVFF